MAEIQTPEVPRTWLTFIDAVDRYRLALNDPYAYLDIHGDGIKKRFSGMLNPYSENTVLIPVFNAKGLPWTLDQFSRQAGKKPDKRIIVFQNGKAPDSPERKSVEQAATDLGVEYIPHDKALGPWGARAYGLYHFNDLFGHFNTAKFIWTYDEDTGPLFSAYTDSVMSEFDKNNKLGALYSPAIFVTAGGCAELAKLFAYKTATMSVHAIKSALGKPHTVGSTAVFRKEALFANMHPLWNFVKEGNPDMMKEDEILKVVVANGFTAQNTFRPSYWNLTAGDKLVHFGIGPYAKKVLSAQIFGTNAFANMYKAPYVNNNTIPPVNK